MNSQSPLDGEAVSSKSWTLMTPKTFAQVSQETLIQE